MSGSRGQSALDMVCTLGTWECGWGMGDAEEVAPGGKGATHAEPWEGFWILIQGRGESLKAFKLDSSAIRFLFFKTLLWSCTERAKRGPGTLPEATTAAREKMVI